MNKCITYIRKNDVVRVMTGKEKGKSGRVLKILPKKSRALVEKLNMVKRHRRPSNQNPQGGILEKEAGIALSNLMLVCSKCMKPVRIGKKQEREKKVRVCKKCGELIGQAA